MQPRKQKTIDKYVLGEEGEELPNGICILPAKHIVSGDEFTVKRMPLTPTQATLSKGSSEILYEEVKKIKDLNIPSVLKCLQVIKTRRSIYLVYEHYPNSNLEQYISESNPSLQTRLAFAKKICETLQEIHRKGYLYVTLNPRCILVEEASKQLKFVGFQSAVHAQGCQVEVSVQFARDTAYCAPEVLNQGIATTSSDIYSVGKLLQMLNIIVTTCDRPSSKLINQTLESMTAEVPTARPNLNKCWSCIKVKEDETGTPANPNSPSKLKLLALRKGRVNSVQETFSPKKAVSGYGKGNQVMVEKKSLEDERKCRQILKIRTLVLYLTDLANFCLQSRDKELFYLLLKKAAIIRSNLLHQAKRVITITAASHQNNKINSIKELLSAEQNESLNLLSKVEEALSAETHPHLEPELEKRNELNESLLEKRIREFLMRNKREVKPFHSSLDDKERTKLIKLCGLSEKLVYGSFETFFDEVVDEDVLELSKQKYFRYLKTASTRELTDRLDRILREKNKT